MPQGQLRVYLGAVPGVGKTNKMLEEGHGRLDGGTDVVIGYVETHGRKHTEARQPYRRRTRSGPVPRAC